MLNCDASIYITNCVFKNNSIYDNYLGGGGMLNSVSSINMTNCIFEDNYASIRGGGMFNGQSSLNVTNCTFRQNRCSVIAGMGAAMYNLFSSLNVTNCIFDQNKPRHGPGGAMYNDRSSLNVTNCVLWDNDICCGRGLYNDRSSLNMTNCILWYTNIDNIECSPIITYCDIAAGYPGEGNIAVDPLFIDPDDGNFHLQWTSPCIDAGNNSARCIPVTDFDGDPRILDGDGDDVATVDMGVDEYLLRLFCGDCNADGEVDLGDVVHLLNYLFRGGPPPFYYTCVGDCNGDGVVNLGDVIYLVGYLYKDGDPPYLYCCENLPPKADAGSDQNVIVEYSVQFDGSGSYDLDGEIVSYEWDFGDDTTGTGEITTHQYTELGSYTVTLTVIDDDNAEDNDACLIQVYPLNIYVPQNYTAIQTAIDYAIDGQTILVAPGIYQENIDFLGKAITVKSIDGPSVTIIDGGQNDRVVLFDNEETEASILEGFTITNGRTSWYGGGIYCGADTSPTVMNNVIINNSASYEGGGIYCYQDSTPIIQNNVITFNTADDGGGIACYQSSPNIRNNIIDSNYADEYGGGINCISSSPAITNNIITNNRGNKGGGICSYNATPTIINNIITNNTAIVNGGGVGWYMGFSILEVKFCDVWNNIPDNYYDCMWYACIEADPLFIDHPTWGPYYLDSLSPCIDAGCPLEVYNDIEDPMNPGYTFPPSQGTIWNDMGCYGGPTPILFEWPNYLPVAEAGSDQAVFVGSTVIFDGSGSYDLFGSIVSYEWDFDDNTAGTGQTTTHQYNNTGTYNVTLTVTDDEGLTDTDTCLIHVLGPIIYVPQDFSTIQEAINVAFDGHIIQVAPDTFIENINFLGKEIIVQSTEGPEVTIIDGSQIGSVVTFDNDETTSSVLEGFTITNGSADKGSGIYCRFASPTIINNIVKCNDAEVDGGGIYCYHSSSVITNNIIAHNTVEEYNGGGIYCKNSFPIIANNVISNNTANQGGGIFCDYSSPNIMNNIITDNTANAGGGIGAYWGSSPTITYCNVWNNVPDNYDGCSPGTGCIETNPFFIDHHTWGPYYLDSLSPCIDAGNHDPIYNDVEDPLNPGFALPPGQNTIRNDMGCYGGPTPLIYFG
jgi:parallel beta-helix repeat protein